MFVCSFIFVAIVLFNTFCVGVAATPFIDDAINIRAIDPNETWWTNAALYQIYPRSFQDSNGDGVGDLNGITSRLKYIKELGIRAFWLNPIFQSPLKDFGYDISNYEEIHHEYGTMKDFENLIAEATKLGLGVLLDFVPNHTSDQSDWFKKSIKRDGKFTNYYIWNDGKKDDNGKPIPPNNWRSIFGGSAWTWNDERKQFYFHQFYKEQPDLNYRNQDVVEEMNNVFRFWMKKGISGFRIDATNHMFEDLELRDEPLASWGTNPENWGDLDHIYTKDLTECYDMIYNWRRTLDEYAIESKSSRKILINEAFTSIENSMRYYQSSNGTLGSHFPYNDGLINIGAGSNANDLKNAIKRWMDNIPKGHVADWPIGSHDSNRVGTRVGSKNIGIMNTINLMLPGASITYYGEEIGMENNPKIVVGDERNPARTPMQWDNSTSAGFSKSSKTWLLVHDNYATINVQTMTTSVRSHLKHYHELMALRQENVLKNGDLRVEALNDNVLAFTRSLNKEKPFAIIVNLGATKATVNLTIFDSLPENLIVKSSTVISRFRVNDKVDRSNVKIDGHDALVLQGSSASVLVGSILMMAIAVVFQFLH